MVWRDRQGASPLSPRTFGEETPWTQERRGDRRFELLFPHGDGMLGPVWGSRLEGEKEPHGEGREAGSEAEEGRGV